MTQTITSSHAVPVASTGLCFSTSRLNGAVEHAAGNHWRFAADGERCAQITRTLRYASFLPRFHIVRRYEATHVVVPLSWRERFAGQYAHDDTVAAALDALLLHAAHAPVAMGEECRDGPLGARTLKVPGALLTHAELEPLLSTPVPAWEPRASRDLFAQLDLRAQPASSLDEVEVLLHSRFIDAQRDRDDRKVRAWMLVASVIREHVDRVPGDAPLDARYRALLLEHLLGRAWARLPRAYHALGAGALRAYAHQFTTEEA